MSFGSACSELFDLKEGRSREFWQLMASDSKTRTGKCEEKEKKKLSEGSSKDLGYFLSSAALFSRSLCRTEDPDNDLYVERHSDSWVEGELRGAGDRLIQMPRLRKSRKCHTRK
ncbi:hypothetical protein RRG08_060641 [Elysia crispata]|uniref:Uncharacterized protein n=1 Tax=Elysia crispata TaxID=231223 RepID=A0AAE0Z487_9GAST|nr:hypothetical protein RRG08_060641 [Elysia crispata]